MRSRSTATQRAGFDTPPIRTLMSGSTGGPPRPFRRSRTVATSSLRRADKKRPCLLHSGSAAKTVASMWYGSHRTLLIVDNKERNKELSPSHCLKPPFTNADLTPRLETHPKMGTVKIGTSPCRPSELDPRITHRSGSYPGDKQTRNVLQLGSSGLFLVGPHELRANEQTTNSKAAG